MTEKEDLQLFLYSGFRPLMVLRDVDRAEVEANNLPRHIRYALPMWHTDGRKVMFYMADQDTIGFANELVRNANSVIGYSLCVYLSAVGQDTIHGRTVNLESVAQCLRELKGWDVVESQYQNVLEIRFEIVGDDQERLQQCVDEVETVALSLSLENKLGFAVEYYSPGAKYRGQPFGITVGLVERLAKAISAADIERTERLRDDERCRFAAVALQIMYSQVTPGACVIKGFAALEKVLKDDLDRGLEHILSDEELNAVITSLQTVFPNVKDAQKLNELEKVIRDKKVDWQKRTETNGWRK